MTSQERTLLWMGVAGLCAVMLAAELFLAPAGPATLGISGLCVLVLLYALFKAWFPRRNRWND